jgi:hypothetical protein
MPDVFDIRTPSHVYIVKSFVRNVSKNIKIDFYIQPQDAIHSQHTYRDAINPELLTLQDSHHLQVPYSYILRPITLTQQDALHQHIVDTVAGVRDRIFGIQSTIHETVTNVLLIIGKRNLTIFDANHHNITDTFGIYYGEAIYGTTSIHRHIPDVVDIPIVAPLSVVDSRIIHIGQVFELSPAIRVFPIDSVHKYIDNPFNIPKGIKYAYMFIARDSPYVFAAKDKKGHNAIADDEAA